MSAEPTQFHAAEIQPGDVIFLPRRDRVIQVTEARTSCGYRRVVGRFADGGRVVADVRLDVLVDRAFSASRVRGLVVAS